MAATYSIGGINMNHSINEQLKQTPEHQEAIKTMSNDTISFTLITPEGEKIEMDGLKVVEYSKNESK